MARYAGVRLFAFAALFVAGPGVCQVVPDNGSGTANLPPAPFAYAGTTQIVNGLAPGDTINNVNTWYGYVGVSEVPGGALGGMVQSYTALMSFAMTGTGTLASFSRSLVVPLSTVQTQSSPRVPFTTPQAFTTDLFMLQGQLPPGDPDFDLLRITAGTGFGLPSPGSTILTQAGSNWAVTSVFTVQYRIDFIGHPGGALTGLSGSTTASSDFVLGSTTPVELMRFAAD